jgi:hypothetical protein
MLDLVNLRLIRVWRTHFNKGIENQLLLRLAIGGGCHVVGARDHLCEL